MSAFAPKKVKVLYDGEAAFQRSRKRQDDGRDFYRWQPRKRNSDGSPSRALRVYYLRNSATDEEVKKLFQPFGFIRFYRRDTDKQFAWIVFDKLSEARTAKRMLEHTKQEVLLRQATTVGYRSYAFTGMKIDYVKLTEAQPDSTQPLHNFFTHASATSSTN